MLASALLPGMLIGAALGLLGGGGSVLAVPIFVYLLGFGAKEAIAMSLAVVAAAGAIGAASHWRAGTVNVSIAVIFGVVAMLGTLLGVQLARFVSDAAQLLMLAAVMLAAALFMLMGRRPESEEGRPHTRESRVGSALRVAPAALLVGTMTGVVGVGGGFLIVPALVWMGIAVHQAVGTSLLVITGTCVVGFLGYLGHVELDWSAMALVAAGTIPGIMFGAYLNRFVPQAVLRRAFAVFLVVLGIAIVLENLAPLQGIGGVR